MKEAMKDKPCMRNCKKCCTQREMKDNDFFNLFTFKNHHSNIFFVYVGSDFFTRTILGAIVFLRSKNNFIVSVL